MTFADSWRLSLEGKFVDGAWRRGLWYSEKGGESKNLELEMEQTDQLLIVLFCFGHKQSHRLTRNILSPDLAFTPSMNQRGKFCQVCVSSCPGKPIHTPSLP